MYDAYKRNKTRYEFHEDVEKAKFILNKILANS